MSKEVIKREWSTNRKLGDRGELSPEIKRESRDLLLDKTVSVMGHLYGAEFYRWADASLVRASKISAAENEVNEAYETGSEEDFMSACERYLELHRALHIEWRGLNGNTKK